MPSQASPHFLHASAHTSQFSMHSCIVTFICMRLTTPVLPRYHRFVPYRVILKESEEGWAVWVPTLPGCVSQGETEQDALNNIAVAIREYLDALQQLS